MAEPNLSFNWSTPVDEDHPIEQDIAQDDTTPTIIQQAELQGWKAAYYDFGKLENQGTDYFNPAIIERPDGPWLITRASGFHEQGFMYGQNTIIAFKLDDECIQPHHGKILRWPVDNPKQHFEDPRAFYFPEIDQTIIGCCTFLWNGPGDWSGPHQCFGTFDSEWNCKKMDYPIVGGNPGTMEKILEHKNYEKNWCWFLHENKLHLLYKANPWLVIAFNDRWSDRTEYKGEPASWGNGEIRGGTAPVRVGDYYFTFHHSSLPWKGRYRRYYAGCIAFEAKPPFLPKLITYQPLLQGSQNDPWAQHKPLVIFPCGAIHRDGTWIVSCGVNDLKSAWIQIPHKDLLRRMQPIGEDNSYIFERTGLSPAELRKERLRQNLVKAREARRQKHLSTVAALPDNKVQENEASTVGGGGLDPVEVNSTDVEQPHSCSGAQTTLEKRRAALVKARAARQAKRLAANGAIGVDGVSCSPSVHGSPVETSSQPKRRRRRRFKRITAASRTKALEEYEAQKKLVSPKEE